MDRQSSSFRKHIKCENCGSSDANALYSDGHQYCFSCQKTIASPERQADFERKREAREVRQEQYQQRKESTMSNTFFIPGRSVALPSRKITAETCTRFGYKFGKDRYGNPVHIAEFFDEDGNLVAQKLRTQDKNFPLIGDKKSLGLWGRHLWKAGKASPQEVERGIVKSIVVTEGEIDAMSVHQALGPYSMCVSVPNGAQSAKKYILESASWLEQFDQIVLCFDQDEPGKKAAKECAAALKPGMVRIMNLPLKDANEMLVQGRGNEISSAFYGAPVYCLNGVINASDLRDRINVVSERGAKICFKGLDDALFGLKKGYYVFGSGTGSGKSTLATRIMYDLITRQGIKCGHIALEESVEKSAQHYIGISAKKRMTLQSEPMPAEEFNRHFDATIGNGNLWLYEHKGNVGLEAVKQRMVYLAKACGCRVILLDNTTVALAGLAAPNAVQNVDMFVSWLRAFIEENGVSVIVIVHLRKVANGMKASESGAEMDMSQVRGSGNLVNLSDGVVFLERNGQSEDEQERNTTTVRVSKSRETGFTGIACKIRYNPQTGETVELTPNGEEIGPDGHPKNYLNFIDNGGGNPAFRCDIDGNPKPWFPEAQPKVLENEIQELEVAF